MPKVIAITGASSGIGRATALRLGRDGAAVVLCARRREGLEAVAEEIRRAGGQALAVVADVTRGEDMERLVHAAIDAFGTLDVMICNAGFGIYGAIDRIEPDQMRRLFDVNYMGTYYAARAALPRFRANGRGHLVIVSSIVGQRGVPYMGAYSATKFAQVGMAECLRAELAGTDIHVSLVYPISTETEFFEVMTKESGFTTASHGLKQSPEVVANAIARAIRRPVPEVYPYRPAKLLTILNAVVPAFCDRLVKRWGRKPVEGHA